MIQIFPSYHTRCLSLETDVFFSLQFQRSTPSKRVLPIEDGESSESGNAEESVTVPIAKPEAKSRKKESKRQLTFSNPNALQ